VPTYELKEEADKVILDEGTIVNAEVVSIKLKDKVSQAGKPYQQLLWTFAIQEPGQPYDSQYIYGDTFPDFNTRSDCELRAWAQEIMATEFPPGFNLDTDVLVGMQCCVEVGFRIYEKNGDTKSTNFVRDIMRSRSSLSHAEEPF